MTSLPCLERDTIKALRHYLSSGYTLDIGGLIGLIAAQHTPSEPERLAQIAAESPFLLTRVPDLRLASDEGLTPYALLRANAYEHLAGILRDECSQRRCEDRILF